MAYLRFNFEGTPTERPVRLSAEVSDGLLKLTATRTPSDRLVVTMTKDQTTELARLLRSALDNAPHSHPHRRSGLA